MVLTYFIHEVLYKIYSNLVYTVIVVTVFREVTFYLKISNDAIFITDWLYLGLFDGT